MEPRGFNNLNLRICTEQLKGSFEAGGEKAKLDATFWLVLHLPSTVCIHSCNILLGSALAVHGRIVLLILQKSSMALVKGRSRGQDCAGFWAEGKIHR